MPSFHPEWECSPGDEGIQWKTWKTRSFALYDLTIPFYNTIAQLSQDYLPDVSTLRYQWESCVIENITAKNLWRTPVRTMISLLEPGSSVAVEDGSSWPKKWKRISETMWHISLRTRPWVYQTLLLMVPRHIPKKLLGGKQPTHPYLINLYLN